MTVSWYERENRKVLSRCLKTASDGAGVTYRAGVPDGGTRNPNARLPAVERRTGGTSRRWER